MLLSLQVAEVLGGVFGDHQLKIAQVRSLERQIDEVLAGSKRSSTCPDMSFSLLDRDFCKGGQERLLVVVSI